MNENAKEVLNELISKDFDKLWCTDYIGSLRKGEKNEGLEKLEKFLREKLACNELKYFESSVRDKYLYVLDKIESLKKC